MSEPIKLPEALRLADILQHQLPSIECLEKAAAELRRLHGEVDALADLSIKGTKLMYECADLRAEVERLQAERDEARKDRDDVLASYADACKQLLEAEKDAAAQQECREMFFARLENMQKNGDTWLTIVAVLALWDDCCMLAARDALKEKQT